MQPTQRWRTDRRTVLRGAGAAVALAAGPAVGLGGARRPSMTPYVEIESDEVMSSPAGASIVTRASLPKGGFIVVHLGDSVEGDVIGATEPALGQGLYPYMMVELDQTALEPPDVELTAAIYKDVEGDRSFDGDEKLYDGDSVTDTETLDYDS